jgi:small conductance mechanosensitive channel
VATTGWNNYQHAGIIKKAAAETQQVIELATMYGMDVIAALAILIIGWMIAGWAGNKMRKALTKSSKVDGTLVPFLSSTVRYVILIFVIIAGLGKFGVQTASIIALLGTVGLAVGLALQGTLSHCAAGVVLMILRPFKIGLIAINLKTADGIFVYVPNGQLLGTAMSNFSRNPIRRVDITVGVSYTDDIPKSLSVAKALMDADDRILKDPGPQTMVMSLGDSSVNIHIRCWGTSADYWDILFDLNKGIKERI